MMLRSLKIIFIFYTILLAPGCKLSDRDLLAPPSEVRSQIQVEIAKWYDNHTGAVSVTYDHGAPHTPHNINIENLVLQHGLTMDFELVTSEVMKDSVLISHIKNFMLPRGFGFFGHGHEHVNHDALSYDQSLASFSKCYESMTAMGLKPAAYAYPGGWGYHLSTRSALKDAGFLCGRRFEQLDISDPYITPDSIDAPRDWYALPSLVMQSIKYDGCVICINNTEELLVYLRETLNKTAWIILTYHDIGLENEYGFYEAEDFEKDLKAIKSLDLWCDNISDIVLYIRERNNASVSVELITDASGYSSEIRIRLSDGLQNDFYNQPLTLLFDIPENWINRDLVLEGSNSLVSLRSDTEQIKISVLPDEGVYVLKAGGRRSEVGSKKSESQDRHKFRKLAQMAGPCLRH